MHESVTDMKNKMRLCLYCMLKDATLVENSIHTDVKKTHEYFTLW